MDLSTAKVCIPTSSGGHLTHMVLFLLAQVWGSFRRLLVRLSTWILPLLLLFSLGTAIAFDNAVVSELDRLFQGRIYYDHYFLSNYPFSLFGHGMHWLSTVLFFR